MTVNIEHLPCNLPACLRLLTMQISTAPEALQEIADVTTSVGELIATDNSKATSTIEAAAQSLAVASSQAVRIIAAIRASQQARVNASQNASTAVLDNTIQVSLISIFDNCYCTHCDGCQ